MGATGTAYRGRFAPSPTGPLHAGSLVAALASWLDARVHGGSWLVRIEDVDTPRCSPGAAETILQQLATCGLVSDEPVRWQSQRGAAYQAALDRLQSAGAVYPCGCTRSRIATWWQQQGVGHASGEERPYPGFCRDGLHGQAARAWRLRVPPGEVHWLDATLGPQDQDVARAVGDFVLKRADGLWAYQLAVVVDDADQGITHIVRGEDLADNTARQIVLQRALGLPTPAYRHTPLVLAADGRKLSKQNGAEAVDLRDPAAALRRAAAALGLGLPSQSAVADTLAAASSAWQAQGLGG